MTKWDWIALLLVIFGFAFMVLGVLVFDSLYVLIAGLATLVAGIAIGTFLSDWNPMGWV